uniref:Uncharacterized protein n=1 Tax=Anguilla anguilla TaxID=7936 RepID=A0A0E9SZK5_ANGAN
MRLCVHYVNTAAESHFSSRERKLGLQTI